jgi:hypothetical protein
VKTVMRSPVCVRANIAVSAALTFISGVATAQIPDADWMYANAARCQVAGNCGDGGLASSAPQPPPVDPCYAKQNAMRACMPQGDSKPADVDPQLVGTWKLQLPSGGFWFLEIRRDGTYAFHSEAGDGAQANVGTFAANDGKWSLATSTGYSDGGPYFLKDPDTWMASGRLGWGAWHRVSTKSAANKAK